jgi:quinol monooxygenase YgiN
MTAETVRVVAHIRARADKEAELRIVLRSLLGPTRKEPGCCEYRLYQNKQDPQDLTFVEEWESDAALDAHMESPHLNAAVVAMAELVEEEPDVRRYRAAE